MPRAISYLVALGAALLLPLAAARAAQPASDGPVRLSDQDLEQVSAGDGSLLDLNVFLNVMLKNIAVTVNVSNVPITAGRAGGGDAPGPAEHVAHVTTLQSDTRLQTFPGYPQ